MKHDRMYGFRDMARMYFPNVDVDSACRQFRRWISDERLKAKLIEAGYKPAAKLLTPRQVAVIVDHLGEP